MIKNFKRREGTYILANMAETTAFEYPVRKTIYWQKWE
jgi:hypothetical protein